MAALSLGLIKAFASVVVMIFNENRLPALVGTHPIRTFGISRNPLATYHKVLGNISYTPLDCFPSSYLLGLSSKVSIRDVYVCISHVSGVYLELIEQPIAAF